MLVIYQPISGRRLLPLFASRPQSQNLTQLSPLVGAEVGLTGILASEVTDSGYCFSVFLTVATAPDQRSRQQLAGEHKRVYIRRNPQPFAGDIHHAMDNQCRAPG
jgi:hypothetical protein